MKNIYVIWSDWDGSSIEIFTEEGRKEAEDFIVRLKELGNNTTLHKVIRGVEMDVEDVEKVSKVKLTDKRGK